MGAGAYLSDPHVQYGIAATPSAQLIWPNQCSEIVAREILMSGRRVGAEEAQRIGLCNHICPDGVELQTALEMAEAFVALPRAGIAATKRAFNAPLLAEAARRGYVES
jgi:enoyl-CoA hydratase/carnithine racemase